MTAIIAMTALIARSTSNVMVTMAECTVLSTIESIWDFQTCGQRCADPSSVVNCTGRVVTRDACAEAASTICKLGP